MSWRSLWEISFSLNFFFKLSTILQSCKISIDPAPVIFGAEVDGVTNRQYQKSYAFGIFEYFVQPFF